MKIAIITFTDSEILPVHVEFPMSSGNYRTLENAMTDIKLFCCEPIIDLN